MKNKRLLALGTIIVLILMLLSGCSGSSQTETGDTVGESSPTISSEAVEAPPEFSQALSSGKPTLVEFGSDTCAPCRQMKPILEQLSADYKDKLNVVIIDVYVNQELTQKYKVLALPTQIVFDGNGNEITRHVGLWPREQIEAELNKQGIK